MVVKTPRPRRHIHSPSCCHTGGQVEHPGLAPALLPHQLHVQRLKLRWGLAAVLVHVGDVLGQSSERGGKRTRLPGGYTPRAPSHPCPSSPSLHGAAGRLSQEILTRVLVLTPIP